MARGKHDAVKGVGLACEALDQNIDKLDDKGFVFIGFNAKAPTEDRSDWLITVKAEVNGEKCIAFCSGFTLAEALNRAIRDFANLKLKWKVDDFANR
jgi:hypothetical protein